jgi:chromosome partitioning protein
MNVISVVNIAGGVAKTTTAVNFAHALGMHGKRVLVVDLDAQANATTYIGTGSSCRVADALDDPRLFPECIAPSRSPGVDVAHGSLSTAGAEIMLMKNPATAVLRLRKCLRMVSDHYDIALIDAPPSPGILTSNAIIAADELLIPVETKPKALEGVADMHALLSQLVDDPDLMPHGRPRGTYLATQYDARNRIDPESLTELRAESSFPTFQTVIRNNVRIPESYLLRCSVIAYDCRSHGAQDYIALAEEYLARA